MKIRCSLCCPLALLGLVAVTACRKPNQAPVVTAVTGPTLGRFDSVYAYIAYVTDPEHHDIFIRFDWDDGDTSDWAGPFPFDAIPAQSHAWPNGGDYAIRAQARDIKDALSDWSDSLVVTIRGNRAPEQPMNPFGPGLCYADSFYYFTTWAFDPESGRVRYRFCLGNGETTAWSGYVPSGAQDSLLCLWPEPDSFLISAQAQDSHGALSDWSAPTTVWVVNPPGILKWTFKADSFIYYSSPAIAADGTIYVGSYDHYLYAINPDGMLKWRYHTDGRIRSSPAVAPDGTIYVSSCDGYLYALRPDGSPRWSYYVGSTYCASPAIGSDGTIYIGTYSNYFYALNPDGTLQWSYLTRYNFYSSPAIGPSGTVYVASYHDTLYAFTPNGDPWRFKAGGHVRSSPAIGADGTIYFGCDDHCVYALNPNGTLKWSYETDDRVYYASPVIGTDGTVYIGSRDGYLYALNPDGILKWRYDAGANIYSTPAICADGTIIFGTNGNRLYALNPDGTLKWLYLAQDDFRSSPAIGPDGTIYAASRDGTLHAIAGTAPLADSPWPKFRHDPRNTGRFGGP